AGVSFRVKSIMDVLVTGAPGRAVSPPCPLQRQIALNITGGWDADRVSRGHARVIGGGPANGGPLSGRRARFQGRRTSEPRTLARVIRGSRKRRLAQRNAGPSVSRAAGEPGRRPA